MRSERGSVLILVAVSMTVLLALCGLFITIGLGYQTRTRLSAAADAAARAGAYEIVRDNGLDSASLTTFGNQARVLAGATSATLDIHRCTAAGATCTSPYTTSSYVEAIVTEPVSSFLPAFLPASTFNVRARAVAGSISGPNCIITLAPPGNPTPSLELGNTTISMPNCNVADAGALQGDNPNSNIDAGAISIGAGSCTGYCSKFEDVATNSPTPTDQFAGNMPTIPTLSGCTAAPSMGAIGGGGTCYSSLSITTGKTVTLNAGVTYFTGPVTFGNNATLTGTGATLVLANGSSLTTGNNSAISISAPTSGTWSGIAIYQPASNSNALDMRNHPTFNINGVVYAPAADMSFRNGFDSTSDCVLLVTFTLAIDNGNGLFNNNCSAYGGSPLLTAAMAE